MMFRKLYFFVYLVASLCFLGCGQKSDRGGDMVSNSDIIINDALLFRTVKSVNPDKRDRISEVLISPPLGSEIYTRIIQSEASIVSHLLCEYYIEFNPGAQSVIFGLIIENGEIKGIDVTNNNAHLIPATGFHEVVWFDGDDPHLMFFETLQTLLKELKTEPTRNEPTSQP